MRTVSVSSVAVLLSATDAHLYSAFITLDGKPPLKLVSYDEPEEGNMLTPQWTESVPTGSTFIAATYTDEESFSSAVKYDFNNEQFTITMTGENGVSDATVNPEPKNSLYYKTALNDGTQRLRFIRKDYKISGDICNKSSEFYDMVKEGSVDIVPMVDAGKCQPFTIQVEVSDVLDVDKESGAATGSFKTTDLPDTITVIAEDQSSTKITFVESNGTIGYKVSGSDIPCYRTTNGLTDIENIDPFELNFQFVCGEADIAPTAHTINFINTSDATLVLNPSLSSLNKGKFQENTLNVVAPGASGSWEIISTDGNIDASIVLEAVAFRYTIACSATECVVEEEPTNATDSAAASDVEGDGENDGDATPDVVLESSSSTATDGGVVTLTTTNVTATGQTAPVTLDIHFFNQCYFDFPIKNTSTMVSPDDEEGSDITLEGFEDILTFIPGPMGLKGPDPSYTGPAQVQTPSMSIQMTAPGHIAEVSGEIKMDDKTFEWSVLMAGDDRRMFPAGKVPTYCKVNQQIASMTQRSMAIEIRLDGLGNYKTYMPAWLKAIIWILVTIVVLAIIGTASYIGYYWYYKPKVRVRGGDLAVGDEGPKIFDPATGKMVPAAAAAGAAGAAASSEEGSVSHEGIEVGEYEEDDDEDDDDDDEEEDEE